MYLRWVDRTRVNSTCIRHGCINADKKLRKPTAAVALSIENRTVRYGSIERAYAAMWSARSEQTRNLFAAGRLPSSSNIIIIIIVSPSNRVR